MIQAVAEKQHTALPAKAGTLCFPYSQQNGKENKADPFLRNQTVHNIRLYQVRPNVAFQKDFDSSIRQTKPIRCILPRDTSLESQNYVAIYTITTDCTRHHRFIVMQHEPIMTVDAIPQ